MALVVLAGCNHVKSPPVPQGPCAADPGSPDCICTKPENETSDFCICHRNPDATGCFCILNPQADACQIPECPDESSRVLTRDALLQFDLGDQKEGGRLVNCALDKDPTNRRARLLKRQIDASDPMALGNTLRGAGQHTYRVSRGELLGKIAQSCFGSIDYFVLLARVNAGRLESPRQLSAGDQLVIPGSTSCKEPERVPSPTPAPTTSTTDGETAPSGTQGPTSPTTAQCGNLEAEKAEIYEIVDCVSRKQRWERLNQCYPGDFEIQLNLEEKCV